MATVPPELPEAGAPVQAEAGRVRAPRRPPEPRNIVICCDGTGNQVTGDLSNVLKLFRILRKDEKQRVFYDPGVGTIGMEQPWDRLKAKARAVWGLATGAGLDDNILDAYRFLVETYEDGDRVFLFGFSRGAYTVRALAGFIHTIGLLRPDQVNIADYALTVYKQAGWEREDAYDEAKRSGGARPAPPAPGGASEGGERSRAPGLDAKSGFAAAWQFGKVTGTRHVPIHFIGVWDTVASVIVPGAAPFSLPQLRTLPYTRVNPSVPTFRHAMAIDEHRRFFRLNTWKEGQKFVVNPFVKPPAEEDQDCDQVWFAGVHSDVGGGYPEPESSLSKLPLIWMIEQATAEGQGLRISQSAFDHLALGINRPEDRYQYVAPDACGPIHNSLTIGWWPLEWPIPKSAEWRQWRRLSLFGFYWPLAEPRPIPEGAKIHPSVEERRRRCAYRPVNLEPHRLPSPEGWLGRFARTIILLYVNAALAAGAIWLIARLIRRLF